LKMVNIDELITAVETALNDLKAGLAAQGDTKAPINEEQFQNQRLTNEEINAQFDVRF
jgi:hypothetical protein